MNRITGGLAFLGRVWRLGSPYFRFSEERWRARLLLGVIVILTLVGVFVAVQINNWYQDFYTALQAKDFPSFLPLVIRFLVLATINIIAGVYALYLQQMLQMRWRVWMTRRFTGDWLGNTSYYRLQIQNLGTDNPDQRISEDLDNFTNGTLTLGLGLVQSVVTLVSFLLILWAISPSLSFPLAGAAVTIPHYMVAVAVIYAIVGSVLVHFVGRRLIVLNFLQQRFEADFRFNLVRVRENAEAVALYGGEPAEQPRLMNLVERIRANFWQIMAYTRRLTFFQSGFTQLQIVFGIFAAAPSYFAGEITQGVLLQIGDAFSQVESSLSWFVGTYGTIATWKATVDRLLTFDLALERLRAEAAAPHGIEVLRNGYAGVRTENLSLAVPDGRTILSDLSFTISRGDRVLVTGPTGTGKSTLFRAIAGVWPFGDGKIEVPAQAQMLFVPQKPYMPVAPLRAALCYPKPEGSYQDGEIRQALRTVGLDSFADRLGEEENWSQQMSPGEQQRLAIARVLLEKPDWLFLDEATSAVDEAGERQLYEALQQSLPNATIVSVAHRPEVAAYHNRTLTLAAEGEGPEMVPA